MTTIHQALISHRKALQGISDSANIDAEILLAWTLKKNRTYLMTHPETTLSAQEAAQFDALIQQRLTGIPIAYLIHTREFWSLPFQVNAHTLIPRPETEILVERALHLMKPLQAPHILDLGTGCGAIAIAIAHERPDCEMTAVDKSLDALAVAQHNAKQHKLTNIRLIQSDWFSAIPMTARFDVIVSNPPYLALDDPHLHQGDLRFEPSSALCAGPNGLESLAHIAAQALHYLHPTAYLCLEHGYQQGAALCALLKTLGYTTIVDTKDMSKQDRVVEARKSHPID